MKGLFLLLWSVLLCASLAAKEPDWPTTEAHAIHLLQRYIQIASVNPPANTTDAASFLAAELSANGIDAKAYASAAGKVNLLARLPGRNRTLRPLLLLNHMDVVPVDKNRWTEDPFGGALKGGQIWGRGSLDMKSTGIMQVVSLLLLKQLGIVPPRDIVFLSTCDEESGGVSGAAWMIQNHWDELNPEYVLDEGGIGSRDIYSPGKLIFGVSVADKQLLWLKMHAVGSSGHGSQPIADNANDLLLQAISKSESISASQEAECDCSEHATKVGKFGFKQVHQCSRTEYDFTDIPAKRSWRSTEVQRNSLGWRSHARLQAFAGTERRRVPLRDQGANQRFTNLD